MMTMWNGRSRQALWLLAGTAAAALTAPEAWAQTAEINLPAQPLARSLSDLAKQTGVDVLFTPEAVEGVKAPAVAGRLTAREAATRLVAGAPLEVVSDPSGGLIVRPRGGPVRGSEAGYDLRGRVFDVRTGAALPGATVDLDGRARTKTGEDGEFLLRDTPPGQHELSVTYVGYPDYRRTVNEADASGALSLGLGGDVSEVVVTGRRLAERRALQLKKTTLNQLDALYSDDVGKLPDQNVAEAVRRLPGVSVADDQGEGRYVIIRGAAPDLANVTVNGQTAPAPEPEGRQVKLDDIPASMIGAVTVVKTLTPDLDANAIAGQVDVDTLSAFDRKTPFAFFHGTYGGYELNGKNPYELDGTVGGRFGPGGQFGAVLAANHSERPIESENTQGSSNWTPVNGQVVPDDFRIRDYNLKRKRSGLVGNLDWRPSEDVKLFFRSSYSTFSDAETRDQFRFPPPASKPKSFSDQTGATGAFTGVGATQYVRSRTEDDHTLNLSAGGQFVLPVGELDVQGAYAHAVKVDPRRSEWQFSTSKNLSGTYDLSDVLFLVAPEEATYDPARYQAKSVNFDHRRAVEDLYQARADYRLPIPALGAESFLKIGAKYLERRKSNDEESLAYDYAGPGLSLDEVQRPGQVFTYDGRYRMGPRVDWDRATAYFQAHPDEFTLDDAGSLADSLGADYKVREKIWAGYAMASVKTGDLTVLPGVRVEHTHGEYLGKSITETSSFDEPFDVAGGRSYTDAFPGLNLRYDIGRHLVLRGAVTTAIGRPDYAELAPFISVSQEDETVEEGNPDLKPLKSTNLDASVEYYLPGEGVLSASVFYKDVRNPIYSQTTTVAGATFAGVTLPSAELTRPMNAGKATLKGVEFNLQAPLRFLPSPLDGLGVAANVTFIDSEVTGVAGRTDPLPLFDQSKVVGTAQLLYEKYGFSARIAYSYRSHYLDEVGVDAAHDIYVADHGQLDARVAYAFTPQMVVFVEGADLNDVPWRRYQGVKTQLVENEHYGYSMSGGVQLKF